MEQALTLMGVTEERVARWVGGPCGCDERKEKLNRLGSWASRILAGKTKNAVLYLNQLLGEDR